MQTFKRLSGLALLCSLLAFSSPLGSAQDRVEATPSAHFYLFVTVTNSKGFVTGLDRNSFQILVDKNPARIVSFNESDPAASIGILVDFSSSMPQLGSKSSAGGNLSILQQSLVRFFNLTNKSNDYFLVGIRNRPELLLDWTSDTTSIIRMMSGVQPRGNTALYEATYVGIEKLSQGRHAKRVLIVISDGNDTNSRFSFSDLRKLIKETDVLLYSMNVRGLESAGSALGFEGVGVLQDLTALSGGLGYAPATLNQGDADKVFEAIAAELRSQYTLGIEPLSKLAQGKFHKIKVKVNSPADAPRDMKKLTARTREGYYAP